MVAEYESKLISELYKASSTEEVEQVLLEIEKLDISPYFLYPLYDVYKKFRVSSISHYFIGDIGRIQSPESIGIIKSIARDSETSDLDFIDCLPFFKKNSIFDQDILDKVESVFINNVTNNKLYVLYPLAQIFNYLQKSEIPLLNYSLWLRLIFEDETADFDERISALNFFFKIQPKENLSYFVDNFHNIRGKKIEIILSKVLTSWKGSLVDKLRNIILIEGSPGAREITIKNIIKNLFDEVEKLRNEINAVANIHPRIKLKIFSKPSLDSSLKELIDKRTLIGFNIKFRTLLWDVNESIDNTDINLDLQKTFLPDTKEEDLRKPINRLFIYLKNKGFNVNQDLFNIRNLLRIVNLLGGHPDQGDEDINDSLEKIGLLDSYKNGDMIAVQRGVFEYYKNSLEFFRDLLKNSIA